MPSRLPAEATADATLSRGETRNPFARSFACASVDRRPLREDAVVREHEQSRRLHRREVAERPRAVGAVRVAIAQRGRVPVVAVGDVRRHAREERLEAADEPRVGDAPHAVAHPAVVRVLRDRPGAHRSERQLGELGRRVGEHQEDRAEVRPRRVQHPPAVLLRRRARVLVREDDPLLRVLGAEAREEAEAPQRPPRRREALLEEVQRGIGVLGEHSLGEPARGTSAPASA